MKKSWEIIVINVNCCSEIVGDKPMTLDPLDRVVPELDSCIRVCTRIHHSTLTET